MPALPHRSGRSPGGALGGRSRRGGATAALPRGGSASDSGAFCKRPEYRRSRIGQMSTDSTIHKYLRDILIALTAAATVEVIRRGDATVLGTFQLDYFEVTLLWSLCAVFLVTRTIIPRLNDWWTRRRLDWDDFRNLEEDARAVRNDFRHPDKVNATQESRNDALERTHDLEVHLRLLGVQIFNRGNDFDLYDGLATLIKLMQRGDLRQARKLFPRIPGDERTASPVRAQVAPPVDSHMPQALPNARSRRVP